MSPEPDPADVAMRVDARVAAIIVANEIKMTQTT